MDFVELVFAFVKPPSRIISYHRPTNCREHQELIQQAREKGVLLYYAKAKKQGIKYVTSEPWKLEYETLEASKPKPKPKSKSKPESRPDDLSCPYCDKIFRSKPGRTLHIKSKHADKIDA